MQALWKNCLKALLAKAESEMDIAEQIYNLRTETGLSQKELADKLDTSASVICCFAIF
jgi:ribosome-binding protein aMBF1 (putative translation factor)